MTLDEYANSIRDKSVAVIGAGVSNTPLAEYLLSRGCKVTVCDKRVIGELEGEGERLRHMGAELRLGDGYLDGLNHDIIFRTPGLMPFDEHLEKAKAHGSVITSEMELFFKLCPCRIIAVTGSDGKTTTSTIIAELLRAAGYKTYLGGNIGQPLLCDVSEMNKDDIVVLELSSFQLHSMNCCPNIAVITNLSPNHLDKHKDFQDYVDAKRAIYENQRSDGKLVLNLDDPHTSYYASFAKCPISYFSGTNKVDNGAICEKGNVYRVNNGERNFIIASENILLPGEHNVLNYLAAFAATDGLVDNDICCKVAESFAGVEHRLEQVRVLRGVTYINDSIGTSPTRTSAGLRALKTKPIVIAGGYDKHIPFDTLGDELCRYSKQVFLTGATAGKIKDAIYSSKYYAESNLKVETIDDFRDTVLTASACAEEGDIVLLSPACAAFDRFKNFAERGMYFKKIVMELQ